MIGRTRNRIINLGGRIRFAVVCVVVLSPVCGLANVVVEPSAILTKESIDLEPEGFAFYEYELIEGSELVFNVDLLRWRSEPLRILFFDEANYQRFRSGRTFDYIQQGTGTVERAGQIAFLVPETRRYFMVLDNSRSRWAKTLTVHAYARMPEATEMEEGMQAFYQGYFDALDALFDMEGIEIRVRRCGQANAFADRLNIVICRELHEGVNASAIEGARLFLFLHEASHGLLFRWGHQSVNYNQIMVDRLAATLFRMLASDLASVTAAWFAESATTPGESHYVLPRRRAERIASWLNGEAQFDRNWSRRMVVPRMRTPALESLIDDRLLTEKTRARIQAELLKRAARARAAAE